MTYGTSNLEKYDKSKTVFEQFIYREEYKHFWNRFVKSFVRPKLVNYVLNVHKTINKEYKCCNVYNELVFNLEKCNNIDVKLSENTSLLLVHYMTLDYESMKKKQIKNKNGKLLNKNDSKYSIKWYKYNINQGFKDNIKDCRMLKYI